MKNLLYKKECYAIQGAIYNVYNNLGSGFLEAVYQECLELEFANLNIPYMAQYNIAISYNGKNINQKYKADIICYEKIIIEIKAVKEISEIHIAQLINYLNATGIKLGLLVNFGSYPKAEIKRYILENKMKI